MRNIQNFNWNDAVIVMHDKSTGEQIMTIDPTEPTRELKPEDVAPLIVKSVQDTDDGLNITFGNKWIEYEAMLTEDEYDGVIEVGSEVRIS